MENYKKFKRNDLCFCGSKKKYKNCCIDTKIIKVGENYKNEEILVKEKDVVYIREKTNRFIEIIEEELQKEESCDMLKNSIVNDIKNLIDEEQELLYNKYISCSESCYGCCKLYVSVSGIETKQIKKYVEKNFTKKEIKEIKEKALVKVKILEEIETEINENQHINKNKFIEYFSKNLNCSFLDEETKKCKIYEVRPIECRNYVVFSEPSLCNTSNIVSTPQKYVNEKTFNLLYKITKETDDSFDSLERQIINFFK